MFKKTGAGMPHPIKHHKHRYKLILIAVFLAVLFFVVYTSVFGSFHHIGSIITGGNYDTNSSIDISATLDKTSLSLDSTFEQVLIDRASGSNLHIGDGKFSLNDLSENTIEMIDYKGKISFDNNKISRLKGKAKQILINGVSVASDIMDTIPVSLDGPLDYKSIEIQGGVLIRELNYKTSGHIVLGKSEINLDDDEVLIKGFLGDLDIREKMILEGNVRGLEIYGDNKISVSSD